MKDCRESRFASGSLYPYCKAESIIKYGKPNGRQCFRCKNCGKTFEVKVMELWNLYDINRNKLERLHERGQSLNNGEYHIVVEVWVVNSNNKILLTQRHPDKLWGGYWECTGGSVIAGEDGFIGAKRELLRKQVLKLQINKLFS